MSPSREPLNLDEIVRAGLCIGCGLCASLAGKDRLRLVMTKEGRERPVASASLDRMTLERINAICPGTRIAGPDQKAEPTGARKDPARKDLIWGSAQRLAIGYASDPALRHRCSTGGVLTALGQFLLTTRRVKFVLHVGPAPGRPMRSVPKLSFTAAEVLEGAGSRYGPVAPLADFSAILERGLPFALIAKPCDLTAVNNLRRSDPRVDAHLKYMLTLVCGGVSDLTKSEDVLRQFGVHEDELSLFRYRGFGNPGPTRIETKDGRGFEIAYQDLWRDEAKWMIQPRCKICPDAMGELADIAASDVWPGGGPTGEDAGFNGIIARSTRGAELLAAAIEAGVLRIEREIDFADMDRFQPHQVRKKRAIWARLAGMKAADLPVPEVVNLRIAECARENSFAHNLAEARGARQRAKSGRLGELKPEARD